MSFKDIVNRMRKAFPEFNGELQGFSLMILGTRGFREQLVMKLGKLEGVVDLEKYSGKLPSLTKDVLVALGIERFSTFETLDVVSTLDLAWFNTLFLGFWIVHEELEVGDITCVASQELVQVLRQRPEKLPEKKEERTESDPFEKMTQIMGEKPTFDLDKVEVGSVPLTIPKKETRSSSYSDGGFFSSSGDESDDEKVVEFTFDNDAYLLAELAKRFGIDCRSLTSLVSREHRSRLIKKWEEDGTMPPIKTSWGDFLVFSAQRKSGKQLKDYLSAAPSPVNKDVLERSRSSLEGLEALQSKLEKVEKWLSDSRSSKSPKYSKNKRGALKLKRLVSKLPEVRRKHDELLAQAKVVQEKIDKVAEVRHLIRDLVSSVAIFRLRITVDEVLAARKAFLAGEFDPVEVSEYIEKNRSRLHYIYDVKASGLKYEDRIKKGKKGSVKTRRQTKQENYKKRRKYESELRSSGLSSSESDLPIHLSENKVGNKKGRKGRGRRQDHDFIHDNVKLVDAPDFKRGSSYEKYLALFSFLQKELVKKGLATNKPFTLKGITPTMANSFWIQHLGVVPRSAALVQKKAYKEMIDSDSLGMIITKKISFVEAFLLVYDWWEKCAPTRFDAILRTVGTFVKPGTNLTLLDGGMNVQLMSV
jgi:hypothetical protein